MSLSKTCSFLSNVLILLRSECQSGMCAQLRTVAASNNRVHMPWSLYYCLFTPHTCGVVLRAHSVRGESHIERNANGEVTTIPQNTFSAVFPTPCSSFFSAGLANPRLASRMPLFAQCQAKFLTYLLFVSYFASQRKGTKFGDYFFDVCCVNKNFLVRCQIPTTGYSTGITITTQKY